MNDSQPRAGERGVSILAALVLTALLGGLALTTSNSSSPAPVAVISQQSQLAQAAASSPSSINDQCNIGEVHVVTELSGATAKPQDQTKKCFVKNSQGQYVPGPDANDPACDAGSASSCDVQYCPPSQFLQGGAKCINVRCTGTDSGECLNQNLNSAINSATANSGKVTDPARALALLTAYNNTTISTTDGGIVDGQTFGNAFSPQGTEAVTAATQAEITNTDDAIKQYSAACSGANAATCDSTDLRNLAQAEQNKTVLENRYQDLADNSTSIQGTPPGEKITPIAGQSYTESGLSNGDKNAFMDAAAKTNMNASCTGDAGGTWTCTATPLSWQTGQNFGNSTGFGNNQAVQDNLTTAQKDAFLGSNPNGVCQSMGGSWSCVDTSLSGGVNPGNNTISATEEAQGRIGDLQDRIDQCNQNPRLCTPTEKAYLSDQMRDAQSDLIQAQKADTQQQYQDLQDRWNQCQQSASACTPQEKAYLQDQLQGVNQDIKQQQQQENQQYAQDLQDRLNQCINAGNLVSTNPVVVKSGCTPTEVSYLQDQLKAVNADNQQADVAAAKSNIADTQQQIKDLQDRINQCNQSANACTATEKAYLQDQLKGAQADLKKGQGDLQAAQNPPASGPATPTGPGSATTPGQGCSGMAGIPIIGGLFGGGGNCGGANSGGLGNTGNLLQTMALMRMLQGNGSGGLFGGSTASAQQAVCTSDPNLYNQQVQQYQYQLQLYNYQKQQSSNNLTLPLLLSGGGNSNSLTTMMLLSSMNNNNVQPPAVPCYQPAGTSPYGGTVGANGQMCYSAPVQPDPSQCKTGSWRPTYDSNQCPNGWQCVPNAGSGPTAQIACQPQVADTGMTVGLTYSCTNATSATSNGFDNGGALSGNATVNITTPPPGTNTLTYGLTCANAGVSSSAQCTVQIGKPSISVVAIPKTVASGQSSQIGWVTSGMQACIISSPQLQDFTTQNAGNTSPNGTASTPAMTSAAQFILHCETVGGGTRDVAIAIHISGVSDNLTDSAGGSGIGNGGGNGSGGSSGSGGDSGSGGPTNWINVQSTMDAQTVASGSSSTISWSSEGEASSSAVALFLVDERTNQATALIADGLPIEGSYNWTLPTDSTQCQATGQNVCASDLVSGRQYAIEATIYSPSNAYVGNGPVPAHPINPTYGDFSVTHPFTLQ